jgi:hypothetical protein
MLFSARCTKRTFAATPWLEYGYFVRSVNAVVQIMHDALDILQEPPYLVATAMTPEPKEVPCSPRWPPSSRR